MPTIIDPLVEVNNQSKSCSLNDCRVYICKTLIALDLSIRTNMPVVQNNVPEERATHSHLGISTCYLLCG
uniref:Uncharacterized protein n=1 Tax=Anguilla anguilla TaxID=7936 RepID=A0A0E9V1R4_ANGAN